jgi:hypothetical protein
VVLYGCETWSLTLREEHRLRVFENRVLRRISELKRDEMMGGWRNYEGTMLQTGRSRVRYPMRLFFNLPNLSGRSRPWGLLSL